MKKIFSLTILFCCLRVCPVTLWDDALADIYARKVNYKVNDSVKVLIDENSKLSYRSSSKSLKNYSINTESKELVGIFELVPNGSVNEKKDSQEEDEISYFSEIQGQILAINDPFLTVNAAKTVSINNKTSRIELQGDVAFKDLSGNQVRSSDMMNQTLRITTAIENISLPIGEEDLEEIMDTSGDLTLPTGTYGIRDAKKRELLLSYLNKILNVIF